MSLWLNQDLLVQALNIERGFLKIEARNVQSSLEVATFFYA